MYQNNNISTNTECQLGLKRLSQFCGSSKTDSVNNACRLSVVYALVQIGLAYRLYHLMVYRGHICIIFVDLQVCKSQPIQNQQRVDEDISSFSLKLPTLELEDALFVKNCLEKKPLFKNTLPFLVLMGTSMVIGDGILTPSMSGASCQHYIVLVSSTKRDSEISIHLKNALLLTLLFLCVFSYVCCQ